jgi:ABC-type uncharacterized transport system involved in gliding motility auxiliary subunit
MKRRSAVARWAIARICVSWALLGAGALACTRPPAQVEAVIRKAPVVPVAPTVTTNHDEPTPEADPSRYSLGAGSERIVRSLKGPLQVDVYFVRGLPQLDRLASDLGEVLAAYEQQGQGKLKFRLIEANTNELRQQARKEGLTEQPFRRPGETDPSVSGPTSGYLGLVFRYGSEKFVMPLPPEAGLEFWITGKIREIRDKADEIQQRIGVVVGKKELRLRDNNLTPRQDATSDPSIQRIFELSFPFYRIEEVDLKRGASAVDADLAGLVITQPQEDYTLPELRRIDEFLMRGQKSLVVFASAVNLKPSDPRLEARLSTRGLEPLLDGYGIHMNKDAVFDHIAQFRVPVRTQLGNTWLTHPAIVSVVSEPRMGSEPPLLDGEFPVFFHMQEVMFPFASSLELRPDKQPSDVTLGVVARSTPDAAVETTSVVDMRLRDHWPAQSSVGQRALAAYAQGRLRSAFAGKPRGPAVERAPTNSRVLVISSSLFITNPFAYAGNGVRSGGGDAQLLSLAAPYTKYLTSTILVLKNTLDWMIGDEDLIELSAKIGASRDR